MIGYLSNILPAYLRAQRAPTGQRTVRTRHRVGLGQIDFNRHMNQAAYARASEVARVYWLIQSGAWPRWREAGVNPVVASQTITYRRELAPLQAYEIDTRATGMDGRLLKVEQAFIVGQRVHAANHLSLIFVGHKGVLSAEDTLAACEGLFADPLPIQNWTLTTG